ncbi:MAG: segregation/condensation protein A [Synergistaceae bacterium]|nr:segregation/condensation protein A [Synergistaceae bacterium]
MQVTDLAINIDGYSGPFDLLCSLVENRKFQVSGIKISQLIRIYGLYLVKSKQTPADTLAEFFSMTAGLLLEKTHSLLPGAKGEDNFEFDFNGDDIPNEQEFMKSLERYKPYRQVYLWLAEKFSSHSKSFRREIPVEPNSNPEREIIIDTDGSGAYLLGKTWKSLHERHAESLRNRQNFEENESNADWDGFAGDDLKQIEARVAEVSAMLEVSDTLSLREIAGKNLVVTLLAVLELCRMGKVYIEQDELFADVRVITKN